MENELKTSLFEKAMNWYTKGGKFREAALELFPEEQLKREIKNYEEKQRQEKINSREKKLNKLMVRAKETFPIGTVVYNDCGYLGGIPQIIISEPYIGNTAYSEHVPYSEYASKKTILAKTLRLYNGQPDYERGSYDIVGIENLINYIDTPSQLHPYPIVDLDKYCEEELKRKENNIKKTKENINKYEKELEKLKLQLKTYNDYNPRKLTKERVMMFVEEDKKRQNNNERIS